MSALPITYIMWNHALMERLLIEIVTTGTHLSPKKWRDAGPSFYSCSQPFINIFHANELRRSEEIICLLSMETLVPLK